MWKRQGPIIDMKPDGTFVVPPRQNLAARAVKYVAIGACFALGIMIVDFAFKLLPFFLLLLLVGYMLWKLRWLR